MLFEDTDKQAAEALRTSVVAPGALTRGRAEADDQTDP